MKKNIFSYSFEEQEKKINYFSLHEEHQNKVIIIIHHFLAQAEDFFSFAKLVQQNNPESSCHLLDLPSHGSNDGRSTNINFQEISEAIFQFTSLFRKKKKDFQSHFIFFGLSSNFFMMKYQDLTINKNNFYYFIDPVLLKEKRKRHLLLKKISHFPKFINIPLKIKIIQKILYSFSLIDKNILFNSKTNHYIDIKNLYNLQDLILKSSTFFRLSNPNAQENQFSFYFQKKITNLLSKINQPSEEIKNSFSYDKRLDLAFIIKKLS